MFFAAKSFIQGPTARGIGVSKFIPMIVPSVLQSCPGSPIMKRSLSLSVSLLGVVTIHFKNSATPPPHLSNHHIPTRASVHKSSHLIGKVVDLAYHEIVVPQ